jgi:hypothetical protein
MMVWEYDVREIDPTWVSGSGSRVPDGNEIIKGYLNGMGDDGLELVGFIPPRRERPNAAPPVDPYVFHAIFKRPKR